MDIEKIRTLIALMEENELVNLEVSSDDEHISLTRHYEAPVQTIMAAPAAGVAPAAVAKAAAKAGKVENSPMVGVFYSAPTPNDPPFVKVGQQVEAGDTIGIIEAMKMMYEVKADFPCTIKDALVDEGDVVEYGQPLFIIEPTS